MAHQLFNPEEAFVRVGQMRSKGCLVIASAAAAVRLFFEDGHVIAASGASCQGEAALQEALHLDEASFLWLPEVAPKEKNMRLNVMSYAIQHSIARDAKVGATGKVAMDATAVTEPPKKPAPSSNSYFYFMAEGHTREELRLRKANTIVGRDGSCDMVLRNIQVSRRHCLMEVKPQGVYFKDLDSTNGVKINGIPATEGFFNHGDTIEFGTFKMVLNKEGRS